MSTKNQGGIGTFIQAINIKNLSAMNKKDIFALLGFVIFLFLIPIILNWLLPMKWGLSNVGAAEEWLSFWGIYIGAICTAIMAFLTYLMMRKTVNMQKTNWRISWLKSYREATIDLMQATNLSEVKHIAQSLFLGNVEDSLHKAKQIDCSINRCSDNITLLLKEYEDLYEDKNRFAIISKQFNAVLQPYMLKIGELVQLAVIFEFISGSSNNLSETSIRDSLIKMKETIKHDGYLHIVDAIEQLETPDDNDAYSIPPVQNVMKEALLQLNSSFDGTEQENIEKVLIDIYANSSKLTHNFCFTMKSSKKETLPRSYGKKETGTDRRN